MEGAAEEARRRAISHRMARLNLLRSRLSPESCRTTAPPLRADGSSAAGIHCLLGGGGETDDAQAALVPAKGAATALAESQRRIRELEKLLGRAREALLQQAASDSDSDSSLSQVGHDKVLKDSDLFDEENVANYLNMKANGHFRRQSLKGSKRQLAASSPPGPVIILEDSETTLFKQRRQYMAELAASRGEVRAALTRMDDVSRAHAAKLAALQAGHAEEMVCAKEAQRAECQNLKAQARTERTAMLHLLLAHSIVRGQKRCTRRALYRWRVFATNAIAQQASTKAQSDAKALVADSQRATCDVANVAKSKVAKVHALSAALVNVLEWRASAQNQRIAFATWRRVVDQAKQRQIAIRWRTTLYWTRAVGWAKYKVAVVSSSERSQRERNEAANTLQKASASASRRLDRVLACEKLAAFSKRCCLVCLGRGFAKLLIYSAKSSVALQMRTLHQERMRQEEIVRNQQAARLAWQQMFGIVRRLRQRRLGQAFSSWSAKTLYSALKHKVMHQERCQSIQNLAFASFIRRREERRETRSLYKSLGVLSANVRKMRAANKMADVLVGLRSRLYRQAWSRMCRWSRMCDSFGLVCKKFRIRSLRASVARWAEKTRDASKRDVLDSLEVGVSQLASASAARTVHLVSRARISQSCARALLLLRANAKLEKEREMKQRAGAALSARWIGQRNLRLMASALTKWSLKCQTLPRALRRVAHLSNRVRLRFAWRHLVRVVKEVILDQAWDMQLAAEKAQSTLKETRLALGVSSDNCTKLRNLCATRMKERAFSRIRGRYFSAWRALIVRIRSIQVLDFCRYRLVTRKRLSAVMDRWRLYVRGMRLRKERVRVLFSALWTCVVIRRARDARQWSVRVAFVFWRHRTNDRNVFLAIGRMHSLYLRASLRRFQLGSAFKQLALITSGVAGSESLVSRLVSIDRSTSELMNRYKILGRSNKRFALQAVRSKLAKYHQYLVSRSFLRWQTFTFDPDFDNVPLRDSATSPINVLTEARARHSLFIDTTRVSSGTSPIRATPLLISSGTSPIPQQRVNQASSPIAATRSLATSPFAAKGTVSSATSPMRQVTSIHRASSPMHHAISSHVATSPMPISLEAATNPMPAQKEPMATSPIAIDTKENSTSPRQQVRSMATSPAAIDTIEGSTSPMRHVRRSMATSPAAIHTVEGSTSPIQQTRSMATSPRAIDTVEGSTSPVRQARSMATSPIAIDMIEGSTSPVRQARSMATSPLAIDSIESSTSPKRQARSMATSPLRVHTLEGSTSPLRRSKSMATSPKAVRTHECTESQMRSRPQSKAKATSVVDGTSRASTSTKIGRAHSVDESSSSQIGRANASFLQRDSNSSARESFTGTSVSVGDDGPDRLSSSSSSAAPDVDDTRIRFGPGNVKFSFTSPMGSSDNGKASLAVDESLFVTGEDFARFQKQQPISSAAQIDERYLGRETMFQRQKTPLRIHTVTDDEQNHDRSPPLDQPSSPRLWRFANKAVEAQRGHLAQETALMEEKAAELQMREHRVQQHAIELEQQEASLAATRQQTLEQTSFLSLELIAKESQEKVARLESEHIRLLAFQVAAEHHSNMALESTLDQMTRYIKVLDPTQDRSQGEMNDSPGDDSSSSESEMSSSSDESESEETDQERLARRMLQRMFK